MSQPLPSHTRVLQQHATRAAFFLPGFAMAAWAPIVPFAKARAGLDDAALGLVLLCLGTGSLLAMPLAGALTARHGCRRMLVAAALLICVTLPLLAVVHSPLALAASLFFFGAGVGAMDCTMNMQAVVVERESGRSLMSGFHAFYSIGGFVGAAALTTLLSLGAVQWQACVAAVCVMLVLLALSMRHWRGERIAHDGAVFAWPRGIVLLIGAMCFVAFLAEGAMLDWGAVFLADAKGMDPARAGSGFVVFSLAMTAFRLVGDRVVERVGRMRTIVVGAIVAFLGFVLVTQLASPVHALAGFALIGIGSANIVPALFTLTGQQKTMPEAVAIPAISTLGYAGVLAGPALIGFVADATSLVFAFLCVATALLAVGVATRWLRRI